MEQGAPSQNTRSAQIVTRTGSPEIRAPLAVESPQTCRNRKVSGRPRPAVWFPTVRTGTGTDVFTERLATALIRRGIHAEIGWLPHRAEYAPWSVPAPRTPSWANMVHANSWLHQRFLPRDLPLVVTIHGCMHDPELERYKSSPQRFYHRFWIKTCEAEALRRADAVTAVSRYTARVAGVVFGRRDIVTIHNGIEASRFYPAVRREPHRPFRLLFVGNPSRRKGTDLLPDIMRQLGGEFELRYTGTPEAFRLSRKPPPNMTALGRLSGPVALLQAYHSCDALLFPTRLEGLSLVVLEAQSCGLPVITTDGSSLPEVVRHGSTGFLCPLDDVTEFVAAIRTLASNPHLWQRMRISARELAVSTFKESDILDRYVRLYERLL